MVRVLSGVAGPNLHAGVVCRWLRPRACEGIGFAIRQPSCHSKGADVSDGEKEENDNKKVQSDIRHSEQSRMARERGRRARGGGVEGGGGSTATKKVLALVVWSSSG